MNKGPKRQNTQFSISCDYSLPVSDKRCKLAQFKKSAAKQGEHCRLFFTKLFINNVYVWDTVNDSAVRINGGDNTYVTVSPVRDTGKCRRSLSAVTKFS